MYYEKGWQAYLNSKPIDHYKVNYLLRGVVLPAGEHELVFAFEPSVINKGTLLMASGWLLFLLSMGMFIRKTKTIE